MSDLSVSGAIVPDATGTYAPGGTFGGKTYYAQGTSWYIFWSGSYWYISTALGSSPYWQKLGDPVTGTYSPAGGTGNPLVSTLGDGDLPPLEPSEAPPLIVHREDFRRPPESPVSEPVYQQSHDPAGPAGDWIAPIDQPTLARPMPEPGIWAGVLEPALWTIAGLDGWFRSASQPTLPAPARESAGGVYVCDPSEWPIESITLDKWCEPSTEPILPVPRPWHDAVFFAPEPSLWPAPETVSIDEWFQPASQPIRPAARIPPGRAVLMPPEGLITPARWDWQQPIAQPVRRPTLSAALLTIQNLLVIPFLRYYGEMRGLYRIFSEAEYRFYWSHLAPPEEGWNWRSTSSSLPHTPPDTFGDGSWYFGVTWWNGVLDSGFLPVGPNGETYLRLDLSGGIEAGSPPPGPMDWRLEAQSGGVVRVIGFVWQAGDDQADQWAIVYTIDDSTPAEDSPDVTVDMTIGGLQVLQYDLPGQAQGTVVKVRLQTRRNDGTDESPSWVYSEDSEVKSLTIDVIGPGAPLDGRRWPGSVDEG